jgi:Uma2 family endonuclease
MRPGFDEARWRAAKASHPHLRFPPFAPEFVIEVRSPGNRLDALRFVLPLERVFTAGSIAPEY